MKKLQIKKLAATLLAGPIMLCGGWGTTQTDKDEINNSSITMEESENRVYGKDLENSGWIFGGADTFDYWNLYMDRKS